MEKELLTLALNSILHGSIQIVTTTDGYGNQQTQEVRVNDLRVPLVQALAKELAKTDAFKEVFVRAFTSELITKIQNAALNSAKYADLPYEVKQKAERQMKDAGVEVRKYTLVAEVVTPTDS